MSSPNSTEEDGIIIIKGVKHYGDIPSSEHPWTEADDAEVAAYAATHTDEATFGGVRV